MQFPARSRSGVRTDDGMVVFAMAADAVHVDDWGLSCLLWAPAPRATRAPDAEIESEMLRHCRHALRLAMAEGFLVYEDPELLRPVDMLSLRVVKAGREYWARWGHGVRIVAGRPCASAGKARF